MRPTLARRGSVLWFPAVLSFWADLIACWNQHLNDALSDTMRLSICGNAGKRTLISLGILGHEQNLGMISISRVAWLPHVAARVMQLCIKMQCCKWNLYHEAL